MRAAADQVLEARWDSVMDLPTSPFQQMLLGVTISLTGLAMIIYICRLYTRISIQQVGLGEYEPRYRLDLNLLC